MADNFSSDYYYHTDKPTYYHTDKPTHVVLRRGEYEALCSAVFAILNNQTSWSELSDKEKALHSAYFACSLAGELYMNGDRG